MVKLIAFDADDTLWHNEPVYLVAKERYCALLAAYHPPEWIASRLNATEIKNLRHFGYGTKSFTLSMIETAIELTEGRVTGREIRRIMEFAREMLATPVEVLPHVRETVIALGQTYRLMIVTKGDLFEQEVKVAASGLGDHFAEVEIVSEKTADVYRGIIARMGIEPREFLMVGNSLRSDVLPVLQVGGRAIHVPYETTWDYEEVPPEVAARYRFPRADHIGRVPEMVRGLG